MPIDSRLTAESAARATAAQPAVISVAIPLYNKCSEIARTLQSVFDQTFQQFEILVVDDGSTDGGAEIVAQIDDPRVRLIRQANAGVSAARNRAIEESQSELIAFLDADDEWKPGFLEAIWDLRERFPEAGLYATAYERHLPNGGIAQLTLSQVPPAPWSGIIDNYYRAAFDDALIWSSAVAVPKQVFAQVGGFPVGIRLGEDLDMWLRIALRYPIAYCNRSLAIYDQAASNRAMQQNHCNDNLVMAQTAADALAQGLVAADQVDDLREYVYMYQILTAFECAKAGNLELARATLAECSGTTRFRNRWRWWRLWTAMPKPMFDFAWRAKRSVIR